MEHNRSARDHATADRAGARAAEVLAPEVELFAEADPVLFWRALGKAAVAALRDPATSARTAARFGVGLTRAAASAAGGWLGTAAPPDGADRRFADPAWYANPAFIWLREVHSATSQLLADVAEAGDLDASTRRKARFIARLLADAAAPTNVLLTNPVALKRAFETGGTSALRGLRNMLDDVVHNHGRPRQVDTSPFEVGRNLAATPGQVVYRNDLMELIQYAPQTADVHAVPLIASPPWINKYYVMDLAPGRSFIEWAVQHGHTTFAISYRQPDATMRATTMDDYLLNGPRTAIDVVRDITGSDSVNIVGLCLGGALTGMLAAYLQRDEPGIVRTTTLLNTMLDFGEPGPLGTFTDPETVAGLERRMAQRGYLEGSEMAGTFDVLRANDLIFNYVVSGWLMGEPPPAFDILAWNADATRMPAEMHGFYLRSCYIENRFANGDLELAGRVLSPKDIDCDVYVVSAENDHIVPWTSSYRTTQLVAGDVRFVLSSAGHIAGIVNPPGPKARYRVGATATYPADPQRWRATADEHQESWWVDWASWIAERAGDRVPPPDLGSALHPPLGPAPGTYVLG